MKARGWSSLAIVALLALKALLASAVAQPPPKAPAVPAAPTTPPAAPTMPAAAPRAAAPDGFAHAVHARALTAGSAQPLACTSCHVASKAPLAGAFGKRPDHAACYGACHGGPPTKQEWNEAAAPDGNAHPAAAPEPAARSPRARSCLACHAAVDLAAGRFTIAAPPPPQGQLTVTAAFSHPRHQRYAGKSAPKGDAACLSCHAALSDEEDGGRTRPAAATCATAACHDGKAAFAITERCTQCHREAPAGLYPVARPTGRFVHRQHAAAVADLGCQGCHRLGAGGITVERAGHAACASCHAADFGAAQPVTCGACHGSTEPWRPLRADRLPVDTTEFGARLDHDKHAQPCQRCHTLDTRERQLRLPRDHSTCTGAGCHRADGGAAPQLTACAECHQLELVVERDRQRARAPWSVRQRFDHQRHRQDASGAALPCQQCHTSTSGALGAMGTPAKRTCETCHDGKVAFSVTGTGCNRCHGGLR